MLPLMLWLMIRQLLYYAFFAAAIIITLYFDAYLLYYYYDYCHYIIIIHYYWLLLFHYFISFWCAICFHFHYFISFLHSPCRHCRWLRFRCFDVTLSPLIYFWLILWFHWFRRFLAAFWFSPFSYIFIISFIIFATCCRHIDFFISIDYHLCHAIVFCCWCCRWCRCHAAFFDYYLLMMLMSILRHYWCRHFDYLYWLFIYYLLIFSPYLLRHIMLLLFYYWCHADIFAHFIFSLSSRLSSCFSPFFFCFSFLLLIFIVAWYFASIISLFIDRCWLTSLSFIFSFIFIFWLLFFAPMIIIFIFIIIDH